MINKKIKNKVIEILAYDLAIFSDIYLLEEEYLDYDWTTYFLYRLIQNKYLVNHLDNNMHFCYFEKEFKPKNIKYHFYTNKNKLKEFLKNLGEFLSSEELFEAVKKELNSLQSAEHKI